MQDRPLRSSNGVFSEELTCVSGTTLFLQGSPNFIGSVDNVSVKEVLTSSGDFTFSRGSDISATRVDSSGLIEKGYQNTILNTNDFARSDSSHKITSGQAGYDNTNDAWLVNKLAAAYFGKNGLVLAGVTTISFFC